MQADLSEANFLGADLLNTDLFRANLSGASFENVENLTQYQLDEAWAYRDCPPIQLPEGLVMNRLMPRDPEEFASMEALERLDDEDAAE